MLKYCFVARANAGRPPSPEKLWLLGIGPERAKDIILGKEFRPGRAAVGRGLLANPFIAAILLRRVADYRLFGGFFGRR
jgi:hypothetical protein